MARGTTFGEIHTNRDLHLVQLSVKVGPAVPRVNIVDVPGANGGVDLTEALGVGVTYQDRELTWVFSPYPGVSWAATRAAVENVLNGRAFSIILDDEPDWVYTGRVVVDDYETDQILHRITVRATCRPYKLRGEESVTTMQLSDAPQDCVFDFGAMTLSPEITTTDAAVLVWAGKTYNMPAGTRVFADMRVAGQHTMQLSGAGMLTIKWREGSL